MVKTITVIECEGRRMNVKFIWREGEPFPLKMPNTPGHHSIMWIEDPAPPFDPTQAGAVSIEYVRKLLGKD